jgi:trk system potassium uptake protein
VKLIVIGCDRVGSTIAKRFASEGWDVTAVDENESALSRLGENWTGGFIVGHGMDTAVLREAGIEEADSVVVATDGDNTNLIIAQIAQRRFGVAKVLVRVMDPARAGWYGEQGLQTISPTKHAIEMFESALAAESA